MCWKMMKLVAIIFFFSYKNQAYLPFPVRNIVKVLQSQVSRLITSLERETVV